jgi:hypothetical protein
MYFELKIREASRVLISMKFDGTFSLEPQDLMKFRQRLPIF